MRTETERLGTEAVTPLLLRLALPSMIGLFISSFYVVIDRIFVGRYIGPLGLAAMNAAMPIAMLIFGVAILIGRGSSVLYSIALGRRDYEEAQRLFGLSMALFIGASLAITVGGLLFLDPLLRAFGVPESALEYGRAFLSVSLLGTLPWMLSFQNNLIRAEGFSSLAMFTQILGAVVNAILAYVFVVRFQWGMQGAAWATVIAQTASALWVMHFFWRGHSVVKLDWRTFRFYGWKMLWGVLYNGCSPFAINIAGSIIWTAQNHMLKDYGGDMAMAAFGIILTINQLLLTPLFGICMGMQPLIGYNTGARKYRRVIDIFYKSVWLSALIAVTPYLLVQLFPTTVIQMFLADNDTELLKIGVYSMRWFLLLLPLGCGTILISQYFQGVGRAPTALLIAMLRQLLFQLPLTFLLPLLFGYSGVLFSGPIGDSAAFLISFFIMRREISRLKTLIRQEHQKNKDPNEPQTLEMAVVP